MMHEALYYVLYYVIVRYPRLLIETQRLNETSHNLKQYDICMYTHTYPQLHIDVYTHMYKSSHISHEGAINNLL